MSDTTAIQPGPGAALAAKTRRERRLPWGKWAIRTAAISYLTVLLIIPRLVIFRYGLQEGIG